MLDPENVGILAHLADRRDYMHGIVRDWIKRRCFGYGLDIGCGRRRIADVGVDINPECKADHIIDARKLPFEDGKFDYVLAIHVLEHIEDPRDILTEMVRVSNDTVGIVCPDPMFTMMNKEIAKDHISFPTRDDLVIWMVRDYGLYIVDTIRFFNWSYGIIGSKKMAEELKK